MPYSESPNQGSFLLLKFSKAPINKGFLTISVSLVLCPFVSFQLIREKSIFILAMMVSSLIS